MLIFPADPANAGDPADPALPPPRTREIPPDIYGDSESGGPGGIPALSEPGCWSRARVPG